MNLQFFGADLGSEGGADQQTKTDAEEAKKDERKEGATDGEQSGEKFFTQEDVNNIATRESRKKQEAILKDLGIDNFEDAKEGMQKFKEWQDAQKTEAEKKDEALTKLEKSNLETKTENERLKAQLEAMKAGVVSESIEDVVILARNLVSEEVEMADAIKQVVEKYPHFAEADPAGQEQDDEEENKLPRFTTGKHTKGKEKDYNPFADRLAKYK